MQIWGDIPQSSIIFYGPLSELENAVRAQPAGMLLLNNEDFRPKQKCRILTERLRERNIVLDHDIARALATFTKSIGLNRAGISLQHIADFVQVFPARSNCSMLLISH